MLYGGPLGTYLSGLSSGSPTTHTSTTSSPYNSTGLGSSTYLGSGLRRSNSRFRNSNTSPSQSSALLTPTATSPLSSYYTPPVRRKYGTPETEAPKSSSRYLGRSPNNASSSSAYSGSSSNINTGTNTASSKPPALQYSRWSPNKTTSTTYAPSSLGTSSSWSSDLNTVASKSVDYKRLYEEEKAASNALRVEIQSAQKELEDLESQIKSLTGGRRNGGVEQRKMERRISECEEELKLLEKLRDESEKLQAEHRALIRVVSRLNREQ